MNKSQFISFLQNPEKLSSENTTLLKNLLDEFPYFQTAHLLYVKNLHNENSIHYSSQLKVAAAYTSDRKVLYELISRKEEIRSQESGERREKIESKREAVDQVKLEAEVKTLLDEKEKLLDQTREIKLRTQESLLKAQEVLLESQESLLKTQELRILSQESKLHSMEVVEETSKPLKTVKELETDLPVFEEIERAREDMATLDKEIVKEALDASIELENEGTINSLETEPILTEIEKIHLDKTAKHSFADWLRLASSQSPEMEKEKIILSGLIDRFITEQPRISKPKAEFFSPVDKARESVKEKDDLVTETLAKIYEQQGNYARAIKAYEKLSLKYPKKNAFFAARIKEIREKSSK